MRNSRLAKPRFLMNRSHPFSPRSYRWSYESRYTQKRERPKIEPCLHHKMLNLDDDVWPSCRGMRTHKDCSGFSNYLGRRPSFRTTTEKVALPCRCTPQERTLGSSLPRKGDLVVHSEESLIDAKLSQLWLLAEVQCIAAMHPCGLSIP